MVFLDDGTEGRLEVPLPKESAPVTNGHGWARVVAEHEGGDSTEVFKKQSQFDEVEGCNVITLGKLLNVLV